MSIYRPPPLAADTRGCLSIGSLSPPARRRPTRGVYRLPLFAADTRGVYVNTRPRLRLDVSHRRLRPPRAAAPPQRRFRAWHAVPPEFDFGVYMQEVLAQNICDLIKISCVESVSSASRARRLIVVVVVAFFLCRRRDTRRSLRSAPRGRHFPYNDIIRCHEWHHMMLSSILPVRRSLSWVCLLLGSIAAGTIVACIDSPQTFPARRGAFCQTTLGAVGSYS